MAAATSPPRARALPAWLPVAAVAALLVAAYARSLGGTFLWDDDAHVVDNPQLRDLAGLVRIWIPGATPQYYPITFSVFWLEYHLFGLSTLGYDLVNLALHGLNAWLAWRILRALDAPAAGFAAAVFALHPLHVETVAWVMELKNTLSGAFYLAAALRYLRFDREREAAHAAGTPAPWRLWRGVAALFLLALLSKSVTATLPAALALMLAVRGGSLGARRLAPLAPLLALGVALALHTAWVERVHVGARGPEFAFTLPERALIASKALLFYAQKLLAPVGLSFCYERWEIHGAPLAAYGPVALVAALALGLTALAARGWRRGPLALAFYAGSLFPALGFLDFYPMVYAFVADHFAYLPSLGVIACAVGVASQRLRGARVRVAAACVVALGLAAATAQQAAYFHDAQALYRHAAALNPRGYLCLGLIGSELIREAQPLIGTAQDARARALLQEAKGFSERSLAIRETQATQFDLAVASFGLGETEAGVAHALRSAALAPEQLDAQWLAAQALDGVGRRREALTYYERVLALAPDHAEARARAEALRGR